MAEPPIFTSPLKSSYISSNSSQSHQNPTSITPFISIEPRDSGPNMPRKKQKGPTPRPHRAGGPSKSGSGPTATSPSRPKGFNSKQESGSGVAVKDAGPKKLPVQQNQRPIVPFLRGDRILLVGEGMSIFFLSCISNI